MAKWPQIRIGSRWFKAGVLVPILLLTLLLGVAVAQQLRVRRRAG